MSEFRVTFGQRYSREKHPTLPAATPDGWLTIIAPSYEAARVALIEAHGTRWSNLYPAEERNDDPRYYPRGEIARIVVAE